IARAVMGGGHCGAARYLQSSPGRSREKEQAMHHGRAVSGVCVVAVVAALSGCGGSDDTAKFKSGYNAVRGPLNQTGQAIAQEISQASKQTDAQVSASFRSLAQRFSTQVAKLTALKPPSSVATE